MCTFPNLTLHAVPNSGSQYVSLCCRYAAIAMASKLSDMQLGDSVDIGLITKKEMKQTK